MNNLEEHVIDRTGGYFFIVCPACGGTDLSFNKENHTYLSSRYHISCKCGQKWLMVWPKEDYDVNLDGTLIA